VGVEVRPAVHACTTNSLACVFAEGNMVCGTSKSLRELPPTPPGCVLCALAEETNSRVAWYSIFSLLVCIAATGAQLYFLKRFFTRKKLL
jgi:hypothetical protein